MDFKKILRAIGLMPVTECNKLLQLQKDKNLEKMTEEEYWNNKYPKQKITYKGRYLPFKNQECEVPVSVLITPHDPLIIQDLKDNKLLNTEEDSETLVPKIYRFIEKKYYHYAYDRNIWGVNELWEFPFEMRAKGFKDGFDCDSWAIFQASYYIAAGVPSYRIRVVAGMTSLGGHATVYILGKDNKWHHLNSTYGVHDYNEVSKFPLHKDAEEGKDAIGIKEVWFSFNNQYSWTKFKDVDIKSLGVKQDEE